MARGFCYLNVTNVTPTGSFIADPSDTGYQLQGTVTAGATFQIGGDDVFTLYDESFVLIGTFTLATLPEGFQFINETIAGYPMPYGFIDNFNAAGTPGVLNAGSDTHNAPFPTCYYANGGIAPFGIVNWQSDFGWSEVSLFFDSSVRAAFLAGFELVVNYTQNEGAFVIAVAITDGLISNSSLTASNLPLSKFICGWNDEGPVGPQLGPVTNPVLNTTTPAITVTPPAEATIIEVETPTTTITTNATPLSPVTVVLPPGTTVVTITPLNPGGNAPGNPLIIPIDLDVESAGLVIDMALAPTIQLIGDPSGIYTLIPNQRFDVLYERAAGTTTTQTVQIPRPYGITSYVPEND